MPNGQRVCPWHLIRNNAIDKALVRRLREARPTLGWPHDVGMALPGSFGRIIPFQADSGNPYRGEQAE